MKTYYYIGVTGVTCYSKRQGNRFWLDREERAFRVIHRVSKRSDAYECVDCLNTDRYRIFKRPATDQHDEQIEFRASSESEPAVQRNYEERLKLLPKLVDDCAPNDLEDPGNSWDVELARRARKLQAKCGEQPWDVLLESIEFEGASANTNDISPRYQDAYDSFEWACKVRPSLLPEVGEPDYRLIHEYISENDCPQYPEKAPRYDTWQKYLRDYRRLTEGPVYSPRAGREHGSSIVPEGQI